MSLKSGQWQVVTKHCNKCRCKRIQKQTKEDKLYAFYCTFCGTKTTAKHPITIPVDLEKVKK